MSIEALDVNFQQEYIDELYEAQFQVARASINLEEAEEINDLAKIILFGSEYISYKYEDDHPIESRKFKITDREIEGLNYQCSDIQEAINIVIQAIKDGYSNNQTLCNEIKQLKDDAINSLKKSQTWLELSKKHLEEANMTSGIKAAF